MRWFTWNVQGLQTKQEEVLRELEARKADICVLTETKKKGNGSETLGNFLHLYSGRDKSERARGGVSILIRKNLRRFVKEWKCVNERIITVSLTLYGYEVEIIGVYGPTDDSLVAKKDAFFEEMSAVINETGKRKTMVLTGDLNGRVGKTHGGVVGPFGENTQNDNGIRWIDLCEQNNLKMLNGFFQHKAIHTYTWTQPTRGLRSVLDYFIINMGSPLIPTDVRALRGPECGTDHFILKMKIRFPVRKTPTDKKESTRQSESQKEEKRINLEGLDQESTKYLYVQRLDKKLKMEENLDIETLHQHVLTAMKAASYEALGYMKPRKKRKNPVWWTEDLESKIYAKKDSYRKWLNTKNQDNLSEYRRINREVKTLVAKAKNECWNNKCQEIESYIGGTSSRMAWRTLKTIRCSHSSKGIHLIQLDEWFDYYKKLLTETRRHFEYEKIVLNPLGKEGIPNSITMEELQMAIQSMKGRKATGPDDIAGELLKCGSIPLNESLLNLFNNCLKGEPPPNSWKKGIISSIYKKGSRRDPNNYRGISVTSTLSRVYGKILKKRISEEYAAKEAEEQSGFRKNRSCIDNAFILKQAIEKRQACGRELHMVFIDLK